MGYTLWKLPAPTPADEHNNQTMGAASLKAHSCHEEKATRRTLRNMGCDIHTHAHAQEDLQNMFLEHMGTVRCLQNLVWQGHGYEYHSPTNQAANQAAWAWVLTIMYIYIYTYVYTYVIYIHIYIHTYIYMLHICLYI